MIRTVLALAACLGAGVLAAGCGGGGTTTVTVTETETRTVTTTVTTTPQVGTSAVRVYFLRDGKVAAVGRDVPVTPAMATAALRELFEGPTATERQLGLSTSLPGESFRPPVVSIEGSKALIDFPPGAVDAALAQIVYTLSQFDSVEAVEISGKSYTRATFEKLTPAILVESPLPFEEVSAPLRVRGTANTFEATFEYELTDPNGRIIKSGFTTATSGSGTRGTFDFTIPFEFDRDGVASLIVFERSAADGSRTNLVEIPVRVGS